ncbi:hypothetical protein ACLOJK_033949 [Asimina triloba]
MEVGGVGEEWEAFGSVVGLVGWEIDWEKEYLAERENPTIYQLLPIYSSSAPAAAFYLLCAPQMDESPTAKRWLPLESNPEIMNQFLWGLGLREDEAEFCDVYGFDDELLAMVPKPVLAVLFLFPLSAESESARILEEEQSHSGANKALGVTVEVFGASEVVENLILEFSL